MQKRKNIVLCLALAIGMLFSGMCLGQMPTDSLPECAKIPDFFEEGRITGCQISVSESTACTEEMIGSRNMNAACIRQAECFPEKKSAARAHVFYLLAWAAAFSFLCFCAVVRSEQLLQPCAVNAILHYIHNQDGKK